MTVADETFSRSFYHRTCADLRPGDRVTGEVAEWEGHSPERLKAMKDHLERLKAQGIEAID